MALRTPHCAPFASAIGRTATLALCAALISSASAAASVISTTDPAAISAFQSGRVVLGFDELVVPPGPCYVPLDPGQYASLGIRISARADGSAQTHLCRLPDCGHFGPTLTPPNIIGGGTGPGSLLWRESLRFDFPSSATAIGASSDGSGSKTTLTAYRSDGSLIASVSGDQGYFMGIAEPDIAWAVWEWNYDQSVAGFSLDNVTFSTATTGVGDHPAAFGVAVEPNPFTTETMIRWSLPVAADVRVAVFDLRGRRVASLLTASHPTAGGVVRWNGADDRGRRLPSGVYFVRFDGLRETVTRRVVLMR